MSNAAQHETPDEQMPNDASTSNPPPTTPEQTSPSVSDTNHTATSHTATSQTATRQTKRRSSASIPRLLLLLLLLFFTAVAGALFIPNPLQSRAWVVWHTMAPTWMHTKAQPNAVEHHPIPHRSALHHASPAAITPASTASSSVSAPQAETSKATTPTIIAASVAVHPVAPPAPTPINAGVQQVRSAITSLNGQLAQISLHQQQLDAQQAAIGTMGLRQRLALLQSPAVHLPQLAAAWQEILLLPGISTEQRHRAQPLQAQAATLLHQQRQWQQACHQLADALADHQPSPQPITLRSLFKRPDNHLLTWLDGQFSLYQMPSSNLRQRVQLADQLRKIATNLDLEQWPDPATWQQIQQQLAHQLPDHAQRQALPADFTSAKQELTQLRQQAAQWIKEVQ
ncbi:MAG: hypothetical protein Q9M26_07900 [Mariprofundales bacterium]|nr:hypothetical protein [Mariprofundales bacterium]